VRHSPLYKMNEHECFWPLSRVEAEKLVNSGQNGSFIIRRSSQPGCFAITFKGSLDGVVNHVLAFETEEGLKLESNETIFQNIDVCLCDAILNKKRIKFDYIFYL
jgi:hypothetical protein